MVLSRTGSAPDSACFRDDRSRPLVSWMLRTQFRYPKSGETVNVARTRLISSSQGRGFLRSGGRR